MDFTRDDILKLPKTDLHLHLDGSLRVSTIIELAKEQKVELPTFDEEELKNQLVVPVDCPSLEAYLKPFDTTLSVLQEKYALERVAYELAEDCAKENVKLMEVRYSPILHQNNKMKLTEIVDAVLLGLKRAEKDFDIRTGVIVCGMRHIEPEVSLRLAEVSVAYKYQGVCGFDLAGAEANFPAKDHRDAFYLIHNNNINSTIHAGEAYGPESIAQALHYCGAHRIGHGTHLKDDGDLLNYVNDHRVPLEMCLTSNVQTKSCKTLESHPMKFYYDFGIRVTVNTDNRLMSNTTVTDELMLAAETFDFSLMDIKNIIINGFKSSFLHYRDKVRLLEDILPELGRTLL